MHLFRSIAKNRFLFCHQKPKGTNNALGCYIMNMNTMNKILDEALRLPEDQRLALAHKLLTVGEPGFSEDVRQVWDLEIRERITRYDRGESTSRPANDVFRDIDKRLNS